MNRLISLFIVIILIVICFLFFSPKEGFGITKKVGRISKINVLCDNNDDSVYEGEIDLPYVYENCTETPYGTKYCLPYKR